MLVVVVHGEHAAVTGPIGTDPPVFELEASQAARIALAGLEEFSDHTAISFLVETLPDAESESLPGLTNSGFFSTHALRVRTPDRGDWKERCKDAAALEAHIADEPLPEAAYLPPRELAEDWLRSDPTPQLTVPEWITLRTRRGDT